MKYFFKKRYKNIDPWFSLNPESLRGGQLLFCTTISKETFYMFKSFNFVKKIFFYDKNGNQML